MRRRLDAELVEQGLFADRDAAARAVMAGEVSTSDRRLEHPGEQVRPGIPLHVRGRASYVSRGGLKLERGLERLGCDPAGLACLDVGCSTGGFTDCLLRHGAASVTAVDVGYAQFDYALRRDPRVELLERTNVRDLDVPGRHATFDLAVCDVSFTSAAGLAPCVARLLRADGTFLVLVKPQFECARDEVGPGGVVRDARARAAAIGRVADACERSGLAPQACCPSPITGAKGNHEYLLLARAGSPARPLDALACAEAG